MGGLGVKVQHFPLTLLVVLTTLTLPCERDFKICSRRHIGFSRKWNLTSVKVAASRIYLHIKLGEDISIGSQVVVIYLFLKWRPAAILDFGRSEIRRYFCIGHVNFSVWTKFYATRWWPLKWIFKMAAAAILDFHGSEIWRQQNSRPPVSTSVRNLVKIS